MFRKRVLVIGDRREEKRLIKSNNEQTQLKQLFSAGQLFGHRLPNLPRGSCQSTTSAQQKRASSVLH
jgi:hypothetical protein